MSHKFRLLIAVALIVALFIGAPPVQAQSSRFWVHIHRMLVDSTEDFGGDELYAIGLVQYVRPDGKDDLCLFSTGVLTDNYDGGELIVRQNLCEVETNQAVYVHVEVLDWDNAVSPMAQGSYFPNNPPPLWTNRYQQIVPGLRVYSGTDFHADAWKELGKEVLRNWATALYGVFDSDDLLYYVTLEFFPGRDGKLIFGCAGDDDWINEEAHPFIEVLEGEGTFNGRSECTDDWEHQSTVMSGWWN